MDVAPTLKARTSSRLDQAVEQSFPAENVLDLGIEDGQREVNLAVD